MAEGGNDGHATASNDNEGQQPLNPEPDALLSPEPEESPPAVQFSTLRRRIRQAQRALEAISQIRQDVHESGLLPKIRARLDQTWSPSKQADFQDSDDPSETPPPEGHDAAAFSSQHSETADSTHSKATASTTKADIEAADVTFTPQQADEDSMKSPTAPPPTTSPAPVPPSPDQHREHEQSRPTETVENTAGAEPDESRDPNEFSVLDKWHHLNRQFAVAHARVLLNWAIMAFAFTIFITAFGFVADYQANLNLMPCAWKPEKTIDEPYGVVVGNVADQSLESLSSEEEDAVEKINQNMFDQLQHELSAAGKVGVSQTCDRDVQPAANREEYLSKVREKLSGQLAVSLFLTHEGVRTNVEVELSIGSRERLEEGQELYGYYPIFAGTLTSTLKIENSIGPSTLSELLDPYMNLLRAIASYSGGEYSSAIADLNKILTDPRPRPELKRLAYVLEGNAEGRLGGEGSLDRAETAFFNAQEISKDKVYPRALLGLGEVKYQEALAATKENGRSSRPCSGEITPAARRLLDDSLILYSKVTTASSTPSVPDADVRASYGTGRVRACLLLFGDLSQASTTLHDLQLVIDRFESDHTKTWLQSPASGAYGEAGLVYCKLLRRQDALSAYDKALFWASDGKRVDSLKNAKRSIELDPKACS